MTVTLPPPRDADTAEHDVNHQAEQLVLGAAMHDPTQIGPIRATGLNAATFSKPQHATIWQAILDLVAGASPCDPVAVKAHLETKRELRGPLDANYLFTCYQSVPDPTHGPWHARQLVTLARKRALAQLGRRLVQLGQAPATDDEDVTQAYETALGDIVRGIEADPTSATTTTPVTSWADVDLTNAVTGSAVHPPPTVLARDDGPCLIYPGKLHTFSGESESAKTWLLLWACVQQIAAGNHVIYLDFEDSELGVVGRLLALGARPQHILERFHYRRPVEPLDAVGRATFDPVLRLEPTTVILDGVTEAMHLHKLNPLDNDHVVDFYSQIGRWLAAQGPGVALIDHVVKDQEARGRYGIGGVHKLNGIDGAGYTVEPIRPFGIGQHGISRVKISKDRPGRVREHQHGVNHIADLHLWSETSGVRIELRPPRPYDENSATTGFRPTHLMEKVSRYVEAHPRISKNGIETAVKGKAEHIRLALELLIAEEYVAVEKGPNRGLLHRSDRPFREVPDDDPT